jgi:putative flippase GtrA
MRYLLVGGGNTLLGYLTAIGLYGILSPTIHILLIAFIANVLSISVSFATYKIFVFKTHGQWFGEYLKCYVVYGGSAIMNIVGVWALVDMIHIPFWIAQIVLIAAGVVFSYVGHNKFTFRRA